VRFEAIERETLARLRRYQGTMQQPSLSSLASPGVSPGGTSSNPNFLFNVSLSNVSNPNNPNLSIRKRTAEHEEEKSHKKKKLGDNDKDYFDLTSNRASVNRFEHMDESMSD